MRSRTLKNDERRLIVGMRLGGMKPSVIASLLNMPRSTVSMILTKWKVTGCMVTKKARGRPPPLGDRAIRELSRELLQDRRQSIAQIARNFNVARNTIRKYIHNLGFGSRIAAKKPFLPSHHMTKRLDFAKVHAHWTVEDWKNIIWTDESSFELGKNSRQIRVWRRIHERYHIDCLAPSFKSGRTSIMVWGAFTGFDKSPLIVIPPTKRSAVGFVEHVYEGTLSGFYFMHDKPEQLTLMEDGAPVHRSKYPSDWREAHGIKKMIWPPNSPDLNPIENLWRMVKDSLDKYGKPKNKEEMIKNIQHVWDQVSQEQLLQLISTMPARMQAVIEAGGGSTKW
jgi:transposase